MNVDNNSRRKKIIIFSLILLATAGIASFLIISLWPKNDYGITKVENIKQPSLSPARLSVIMADNEVLSGRLNSLQQLDKYYAGLLTESNDKKRLDSATQMIHAQEELFRASIDSIFLNTPVQPDINLNNLFNSIVLSYRSILENRSSISSLRNAINMDTKSLNPDEMTALKNKNELQERNNRIASLESALKAMSVTKTSVAPKTGTDENITALEENIKVQENRIAALTIANSSLKQDNDKLIKQQNDASKTTNQGELTLKNKAAVLQQKVDELNAELSLAQVDCNLSRVDATQIISNSRQRKELLSQASGILTSLANSDDADIRKKVQDKIIRLNQVAANSRD